MATSSSPIASNPSTSPPSSQYIDADESFITQNDLPKIRKPPSILHTRRRARSHIGVSSNLAKSTHGSGVQRTSRTYVGAGSSVGKSTHARSPYSPHSTSGSSVRRKARTYTGARLTPEKSPQPPHSPRRLKVCIQTILNKCDIEYMNIKSKKSQKHTSTLTSIRILQKSSLSNCV